MEGPIENKVAKSGLITLDLDDFLPSEKPLELDIAPWLWNGLALKEKDFRASVKDHDWSSYADKAVAVFCSEDAIIPHWAYMLIATQLTEVNATPFFGLPKNYTTWYVNQKVDALNPADYADARVILKGCGKEALPYSVYADITRKLTPVVKSLMFGEPCSTVPVFKRKG